jgi:tetratricopeptide (TPR) repeat protein
MLSSIFRILLLVLLPHLLPLAQSPVSNPHSSSTPPSAAPDALSEADSLYRAGRLEAAIEKYRQVLQGDPKSAGAYAGLTRVFLKQKKVQDADDTIHKALQVSDSPLLHVALGEVYFRQGKIVEAETEWVKVVNGGFSSARAYLGLARVKRAILLYRRAKSMIDKAHDLDPGDPEIQKFWIDTLPASDRMKYIESYLAGPNNDDPERRADTQRYLDYLKARAKTPKRQCRLVTNLTSTGAGMERLLQDARHLRGYGLIVGLNDHKAKLMIDTGASGILVNRRVAEKAGVTVLSEVHIRGIGDKGGSGGYVGLVNSIKIGQLEFHDCPIEVLDQRSVLGDDGLIGTDVFEDFLVDLDFPGEKLKLSQLPLRPGEAERKPALQTGDDDVDQSDETSSPPASGPTATPAKPPSGLQDRYFAPEMQSYARVFRFGHDLLIPTKVNDLPQKLFLLDTGGFNNLITPAAAREVTKVHRDDTIVKGLSGSVREVYSAGHLVLQFGHLRQEHEDIVSFDLTEISDSVGTEVSGILGFAMLHLLDIKIDYRDGLVDFVYDAKRGR